MFKLITPPAIEPVSLTEIKNHIRLISSSLSDDVTPASTIVPGSHAIGSITGQSVDIAGYNAYFLLDSRTNGIGGTVDFIIEESNDNINFTVWADGSFSRITEVNDNQFYKLDYTGNMQYVRVNAIVAGAACEFGVNVIKDSPVCAEDTWLDETRQMVREFAENYQGRSFLTTQWELILDDWPCKNYIEIKKAPVQSIQSMKYIDSDDLEHTLDPTVYYLDNGQFWPRIILKYGEVWPSEILRESGAITIAFTAGYTTVDAFKAENKNTHRWMLTAIKMLYDDRSLTISDINPRALEWGRIRGYF